MEGDKASQESRKSSKLFPQNLVILNNNANFPFFGNPGGKML
jgi:hypothetical protein